MSDPRYIIEISRTTHDAGVENVNRIGDLILFTADPVEAVAIRKELRTALRRDESDLSLELVMVEDRRSRVLDAFNEDHFRTRPDRSAAVAIAVSTPGAEPGFDRAMNEAAAAWKSLGALDMHLTGDRALDDRGLADVVLSLEYYDLLTGDQRAILKDFAVDHPKAAPVLREAVLALSATCRAFPLEYVEPVDTDRWLAICEHLREHNPDAVSAPDAKACEARAELDFAACKGRVIEITFVNGYDIGTNNQNDHVLSPGEPPYRVILCDMDAIDRQWTDEDLDPKWDVRPAPDETRLDALRSLWTFGPSYRDASRSQKQG